MDNFFQTVAGREFREYTLPQLTNALRELTDTLNNSKINVNISSLQRRLENIEFSVAPRKQRLVPCDKKDMTIVLEDAFSKGLKYVAHYDEPLKKDVVVLILEEI